MDIHCAQLLIHTTLQCVAWSALMRDKDGRKARRSFRRTEPSQSDSDAEGGAAVITPPDSACSSDLETDV